MPIKHFYYNPVLFQSQPIYVFIMIFNYRYVCRSHSLDTWRHRVCAGSAWLPSSFLPTSDIFRQIEYSCTACDLLHGICCNIPPIIVSWSRLALPVRDGYKCNLDQRTDRRFYTCLERASVPDLSW